jgi:hypothetical protein
MMFDAFASLSVLSTVPRRHRLVETSNDEHLCLTLSHMNKRAICEESAMVDTLLRTGAGPFTDAVFAFRANPLDARNVRIAKIGTFALGQVRYYQFPAPVLCRRALLM